MSIYILCCNVFDVTNCIYKIQHIYTNRGNISVYFNKFDEINFRKNISKVRFLYIMTDFQLSFIS